MAILKKADDDQLALLRRVIDAHHPALNEAGVTVDLMIAFPEETEDGDPKGPALLLGGYTCLGIASITPYLQRVRGLADALIRIDGDWLEDATENEVLALLDHEANHFEVKGAEKDKAGRPKLKMRRHDRQLGFFDCVAKRWGPDSQEHQQARQFLDADFISDYQLTLPGLRAVDKPEQLEATGS